MDNFTPSTLVTNIRMTYSKVALSILSKNEKIDRLEKELMNMPQVNCPIRHYFSPGVYAREITIPAGAVVTGAIHKTENLVLISMGRLRVLTNDGSKEYKAGDMLTCHAGIKNAVVALEDSRWTNFFSNPNNETDTDKLIESLTECKASELIGGENNKQLIANKIANDRSDYLLFLEEYGLSQEVVSKLVEYAPDQIPMPVDVDAVSLHESELHGKGLFASRRIKLSEYIGHARINGKRTPLGRYLNHSVNPNVEFVALENGDLEVYALRNISTGEEIKNCYRQAMRVNGAGFDPLKGKS